MPRICEVKEMMAIWDHEKNKELGLDPYKLHCSTKITAYWRCLEKNHSYTERIDHVFEGRKCPYCTNKRVLVGYNDLKTLFPEIAKDWDYEKNKDIDINTITPGSAKRVYWKCHKCGNTWYAQVCRRTVYNTGCPACGHQTTTRKRVDKIIESNGSLADQPFMDEYDYEKNKGYDPTKIGRYSNYMLWWKCKKCGKTWQAKPCNRMFGSGCPHCYANRKKRIY